MEASMRTHGIEIDKSIINHIMVDVRNIAKESDDLFKSLVNDVRENTKDIVITPKTIMMIVKFAMEAVESSPVKGQAQRDLAIKIIKTLVEDSTIDADDKAMCLQMISSGLLENTIELIVDTSRGKLNINKAAKVATGCFKLFCCFKRANTQPL
jgi:hypothetical protein